MARFVTAHHALMDWAERYPERAFLHQPVGDRVDTYTWSQCADTSRRLAAALQDLGLKPGDKVALLSKNCAEWFLADFAIAMAGMISVPIYPTAGHKTIAHVMAHSEAKVCVVGKLDNPLVAADAIPAEVSIIAMRYQCARSDYAWESLIHEHEPLQELSNPQPGDVMTILYTSGSTGQPKGVVLSFRAYHYSSNAALNAVGGTTEDRLFSYLPLAHITERCCTEGPAVYAGSQCYFVESLESFQRDLQSARATIFISVPRLWVQFQSAVHAKIPPKRLATLLKIPFFGKSVARKIRENLGFSYARSFGSGSAPISPITLKWYQRIGINIGEGWGMSETSGLSCGNTPFVASRIGTIGVPVEGTEMKLSDENEILIRSPGLFTEYFKQPELTREVFTEDGFFHTGDKAVWDEKLGAYRITGRVKDLFKSAKGKYVVPVPIEAKLSGNAFLEQICVMGSGLRAPVAVAVLSPTANEAAKDEIETSLVTTLDRVNEKLESHERLARFVIAKEGWTIDNGLLTPTMKIKRGLLEEKYQRLISEESDAQVQWET